MKKIWQRVWDAGFGPRKALDAEFRRRVHQSGELKGFSEIARYLCVDERTVRRAYTDNEWVRQIIRKRGGRYFAETFEVRYLANFLIDRLESGDRSAQAAIQPRSSGKFAKKLNTRNINRHPARDR